jgi:histidinol-phosphate/aromatic aminotransferase/cobyric acid decarboxylase-like protein
MTARFHNPSGASVAIASAMLKDRDWCNAFLRNSQRMIGASYRFIAKGLQDLGIRFVPANAGFFVYVDLSPYLPRGTADPEFDLSQRLLDGGVFLHPKEEHGEMGWYRMVYTQDARVVAEGLQR